MVATPRDRLGEPPRQQADDDQDNNDERQAMPPMRGRCGRDSLCPKQACVRQTQRRPPARGPIVHQAPRGPMDTLAPLLRTLIASQG